MRRKCKTPRRRRPNSRATKRKQNAVLLDIMKTMMWMHQTYSAADKKKTITTRNYGSEGYHSIGISWFILCNRSRSGYNYFKVLVLFQVFQKLDEYSTFKRKS